MSNFPSRSFAVLLATFLATIAALSFADVEAKAITYDLNIPAEDLTSALQSFAIASHHKLLYKTELTTGRSSEGLLGHFTAEQAMERLLAGTGLTFEITGSSVVLIRGASTLGKTGELMPPQRAITVVSAQGEDGHSTLLAQAPVPSNSKSISNERD